MRTKAKSPTAGWDARESQTTPWSRSDEMLLLIRNDNYPEKTVSPSDIVAILLAAKDRLVNKRKENEREIKGGRKDYWRASDLCRSCSHDPN